MRRDHLDAVLAQLLIEWIAVVGAIADQILRLGLDHVEVEAQLYQPNFVVIGGMRADRERQSMTIHDCHDFHAFPALRRSDPNPATLRHHERRIDEAFPLHPERLCREARWLHPSTLAAKLHRGTRFESADERICSSDSFAAACATARRC